MRRRARSTRAQQEEKGVADEQMSKWLIRDLSEEMRVWGHQGGVGGKVILKSDNEKSLTKFRDELGKYHGGEVIPENPAKGESQSNGAAEEAGKTVRGFVRVFKEQLEDKANIKISGEDTVVQWMIRWAAMSCSRYLVGKDGRTGYERRRGRRCTLPSLPFGEKIWYKEARQGK